MHKMNGNLTKGECMNKVMSVLLVMLFWGAALSSSQEAIEKKDAACLATATRTLLPEIKEKLEGVIDEMYSISAAELMDIVGKFDKIPTISAAILKERMANEEDLLVVNVLDEPLYDDCHISNSVNVPLPNLINRVANWDREQHIVVYCALSACDAGQKGYILLTYMGFKNVVEYPGGIKEWFGLGYPVEGPCVLPYLHEDPMKPFINCPCGKLGNFDFGEALKRVVHCPCGRPRPKKK